MLKKITYIAREAGEMIRCAHDIDQDIIQKTNPADVVTKYDTAVQAYLRRELLTLMPEAGFLGYIFESLILKPQLKVLIYLLKKL